MNIPPSIQAGDSVSWDEAAGVDNLGQPITASGGYALKYAFRGPIAAGNLDLVGTARGTGWRFALSGANTAALNTGAAALTWYWQAVATKAAEVVTLGSGIVRVQPSIANQGTGAVYDGRTQAEKDLAAVQAELNARINGGLTIEYTIGNRSLKKEPTPVLLEIESRCKRIVALERRKQAIANGLGNPGRVGIRFTRS